MRIRRDVVLERQHRLFAALGSFLSLWREQVRLQAVIAQLNVVLSVGLNLEHHAINESTCLPIEAGMCTTHSDYYPQIS